MNESTRRRKPRIFNCSRTARQAVLENLNANGPELRRLIGIISSDTGNRRDACLRFARRLVLKAKQTWTRREQRQMENGLELHKVRKVAAELKRKPAQVYGMMHRLGISGKRKLDKLSMYAVGRLISKQSGIVRQWIQSGALRAENEGTDEVPHWMISRQNLQRFLKEHREFITASHADRDRLRFILAYVFPARKDRRLRRRKQRSKCRVGSASRRRR